MNHGEPGGFDNKKKQLTKNTSKYFTLAGFMIEADKILELDQRVQQEKEKYGLTKEQELKWHTTYSKLGLTCEQHKNMKSDIIHLISQYNSSVIGIVMDKESCYKNKEYINTPNDLYAVSLHLLMERFCMQTTKKGQKENIIPTIMIADSRRSINSSKLDKELKTAYERAKKMGTYFVKFPSFCNSIICVDSKDFSGIQIADFCAGAIHKKYERNDDELFEKLLPAIISKEKNIYGPGIKFYQ